MIYLADSMRGIPTFCILMETVNSYIPWRFLDDNFPSAPYLFLYFKNKTHRPNLYLNFS